MIDERKEKRDKNKEKRKREKKRERKNIIRILVFPLDDIFVFGDIFFFLADIFFFGFRHRFQICRGLSAARLGPSVGAEAGAETLGPSRAADDPRQI